MESRQVVKDMRGNTVGLMTDTSPNNLFQIKMLANNQVGAIRPIRWKDSGERVTITYELAGYMPLETGMQTEKLNYGRFFDLIQAIGRTLHLMQEYLLGEGDLMLEAEHIYIHERSGSIGLLWMPAAEGQPDIMERMDGLIRGLMPYMDIHDGRGMGLLHRCSIMFGEKRWQISDIHRLLQEEDLQAVKAVPTADQMQQAIGSRQKGETENKKALKRTKRIKDKAAEKTKEAKPEKIKEAKIEKTKEGMPIYSKSLSLFRRMQGFLKKSDGNEDIRPSKWGIIGEKEAVPHLISEAGLKIQIMRSPFLIGKMKGHVDHPIYDAHASRIHCKIYQDFNQFYVEDLDSTNGTYVDGQRLKQGEPYPLKTGTIISIGRSTFEFCR